MRLIEFFFGKWSCTDTCLVGSNGLLMVFRHSVTGREVARIEVGSIRRGVSMTEARGIIDSYEKRYQGWI